MSDRQHPTPGTAPPANVRKAACGIRYDDEELQEGIDFSGAVQLRPQPAEDNTQVGNSVPDEHR
ncbi:MAG: hypothetical protein R3175_10900 [Marinobacter sp.]|uniref:hypothetical protein n=1 Tax=Marinobacter sp. TaxID=50741 RepID=UPI00299F3FBE|nr:hypothetical protein [Marinobacter sp.]MDX1756557.1 hypothetical protein [Marinobacter sp.]